MNNSSLHALVFNDFQVNTYIISAENGDSLLIDPACYSQREKNRLAEYCTDNKLNIVRIINTHCHVDHILGNAFACAQFGVGFQIHKAGIMFLEHSVMHGASYGFEVEKPPQPEAFINEGDQIIIGNTTLDIVHVPGHADGSICIINKHDKYVITGDVLFCESIGRTDLPTGDYDLLIKGIKDKLLNLPPEFAVYPGHGPATSIENEMYNNPFLHIGNV